MLPLYCDPHFAFRFAEDRLVGRFHLDGVEAGTPVTVFALDPATVSAGSCSSRPSPVKAGGWTYPNRSSFAPEVAALPLQVLRG